MNRSKGQKLSATISRANDSGDISLQNESQSDGEKNEIEAKPKKRSAKKIKLQDPERGEWKQSKSSISAREKPTESTSKDSGDNSKENASESDGSHSSVEKSRKVLLEFLLFYFHLHDQIMCRTHYLYFLYSCRKKRIILQFHMGVKLHP